MQFLRHLLGKQEQTPSPAPEAAAEETPPVATSRLRVGWATDVGQVRRHNEDTALILTAVQDGDEVAPAFGLFVLADGMGGHQAGEVASSLAARVTAHHIVSQLYLPTLASSEPSTGQPALNEVLVNAVQAAHKAVSDRVAGGGTTLTCALVLGPRAYVAHVGDSRAYIVADGALEQITHDHSLVDRLVELGQLTREEAEDYPQRNVLYRAVGQNAVLEVDVYARTIPPGGRLMLCSDGLWGVVGEQEINETIVTAPTPQAACDRLIAAANQAGGPDNITVILVEPPLG